MCNGTLFTAEKILPQAWIELGLLDQYFLFAFLDTIGLSK